MKKQTVFVLLEVATPILLIALIWVWSADTGTYYFPPLEDVLANFFGVWLAELIVSDITPSLMRLVAGYSIAAVVGIVVGFLLGLSPVLRRIATPVVEFFRAIPAPAVIPFTILVLGIGDVSKIFLIALVCLFPILLNTIDGVAGVEPTINDTSAVYRISRKDRLLRVTLPAASPQIFAGLRTSLGLALILMVISEMVAGTNGIGYLVLYAQRTFAIPTMWAGIILLGVLGYLLNVLFLVVERRVLRWHRESKALAE